MKRKEKGKKGGREKAEKWRKLGEREKTGEKQNWEK